MRRLEGFTPSRIHEDVTGIFEEIIADKLQQDQEVLATPGSKVPPMDISVPRWRDTLTKPGSSEDVSWFPERTSSTIGIVDSKRDTIFNGAWRHTFQIDIGSIFKIDVVLELATNWRLLVFIYTNFGLIIWRIWDVLYVYFVSGHLP